MGCDIHIVLERRDAGQSEWVGQWCSDNLPMSRRPKIASRDYGFFAEVAGVRGSPSQSKMYPRNVPVDVSRLAWLHYMQSPTDHHSPSHATPAEFVEAYARANPNDKDYRPEFALYDLLGVEADYPEGCEYRVVFWFDN
jgi:hypothetical protein